MAPLLAHKSGVDRAFERIYRRHARDVYRYAYAVLRNQADAEDVTQTTFMNAYRALERGETPQTPHNWLIAIAHNVCRQRFRQASRRVQEVDFDEDVADRFVRPEDDDAPSPEDIRRALGHLAFNQRAALVMRELEGRSYAEIADLLDVSVGAVETLIFRARRALREQLEGGMTCGQAEQAISRQLDGVSSRPERSQLRAHLRQCERCRLLARRQRAQRSAFRAALGAVPLPSSLGSLFGGGATVGAAVATKAAAVVVAAGVAGGIGWDVQHRLQTRAPRHERTPAATVLPAPAVRRPPATPALDVPPAGTRPNVAAGPTAPAAVAKAPGTPAPRAAPAATAAPGRTVARTHAQAAQSRGRSSATQPPPRAKRQSRAGRPAARPTAQGSAQRTGHHTGHDTGHGTAPTTGHRTAHTTGRGTAGGRGTGAGAAGGRQGPRQSAGHGTPATVSPPPHGKAP